MVLCGMSITATIILRFLTALSCLFTGIPSNPVHLQCCWNEEGAASKTASLRVPSMDNSSHRTLPSGSRVCHIASLTLFQLKRTFAANWPVVVCYLCLSRPSISAIHRASIPLPCARRSERGVRPGELAAPIDKKNPAFNVTKTCKQFYRAACSQTRAGCCFNTPRVRKIVPAFCLM